MSFTMLRPSRYCCACDSCTPFDGPVVPEVFMIAPTSAPLMGLAGDAAWGSDKIMFKNK